MVQWSWEELKPLLWEYGAGVGVAVLHILGVVLLGWIAVRVMRRAFAKLESIMVRVAKDDDEISAMSTAKRARTLTTMLRTISTVAIWGLVFVMSLDQIGFEIGPLIAGAGIAGLAVGFGAQNLVRDVISGFFMILENQIRVGDIAVVNGTGGLVEAITFRIVTLRDLEGNVHIFPNGGITTLSNRSKGWSAYVVDLGIAYDQDTDEVVQVMKDVHAELSKDPAFANLILEPIEVFGVDAFADSAVIIKARLKTVPTQQWAVGREYNRRLKRALDRKGIEIPFPQRTLHIVSDTEGDGIPKAA